MNRSSYFVAASLLLCGSVAYAQTNSQNPAAPAQPAPKAESVESLPATIINLNTGYLGVYLEEVTADKKKELSLPEERGAIVMKVVSGGPAEKAGLKENDVILAFNGRRVDSTKELERFIDDTPIGRTVALEVFRGGSTQTINAVVSNRNLLGSRNLHETWPNFRMVAPNGVWPVPETNLNFGNFDIARPLPASRRRMGLTTEPMTEQLASYFGVTGGHGLLISEVVDNSPASKAGLKAGDVIVAVENTRVEDVSEMLSEIAKKKSGPISVKIVRDHKEMTVSVQPAEAPTTRRPRAARQV